MGGQLTLGFAASPDDDVPVHSLGEAARHLRGFALARVPRLLHDLDAVVSRAPFRHMVTPGGFRMSVAMTSCGALGWVSDRMGYRYDSVDSVSGLRWPAMPVSFRELAVDAAAQSGFSGFAPDACLINRYEPGARMTLHQDKNERDFNAPIVSVSLGLPATFLFGGHTRRERPELVALDHGDVVVWGGVDRLRFHGVRPLPSGFHPLLGERRINLTFRHAA